MEERDNQKILSVLEALKSSPKIEHVEKNMGALEERVKNLKESIAKHYLTKEQALKWVIVAVAWAAGVVIALIFIVVRVWG